MISLGLVAYMITLGRRRFSILISWTRMPKRDIFYAAPPRMSFKFQADGRHILIRHETQRHAPTPQSGNVLILLLDTAIAVG